RARLAESIVSSLTVGVLVRPRQMIPPRRQFAPPAMLLQPKEQTKTKAEGDSAGTVQSCQSFARPHGVRGVRLGRCCPVRRNEQLEERMAVGFARGGRRLADFADRGGHTEGGGARARVRAAAGLGANLDSASGVDRAGVSSWKRSRPRPAFRRWIRARKRSKQRFAGSGRSTGRIRR